MPVTVKWSQRKEFCGLPARATNFLGRTYSFCARHRREAFGRRKKPQTSQLQRSLMEPKTYKRDPRETFGEVVIKTVHWTTAQPARRGASFSQQFYPKRPSKLIIPQTRIDLGAVTKIEEAIAKPAAFDSWKPNR